MNLTDYQRAAARTSRTNAPKLSADTFRLLNGVMGLSGELREFRYDPSIDEAGDVLWYCAEIASALGAELRMSLAGRDAVMDALDAIEAMKKVVFHGVPARVVRWRFDAAIASALAEIAALYDLESVAAANIDKLRARYPDGFVEGGGVR